MSGTDEARGEGLVEAEAMALDLWCEHPLFAEAGEERCQRLAQEYPPWRASAGEVLLRAGEPGDGVIVLFGGRVAVYRRHADGRELLSRIVEGPALLGDVELLHQLPALHDVEALEEVWLAQLPAAALQSLLDERPGCARVHRQHLAALACLGARGEALVFASLEQRIANVVLAYAQHYGRTLSSGAILVERQLSLKTIARAVGGVWRSVGHALSGLRSKGLLDKQGELLLIAQPAALRDLTSPVSGSLSYRIGASLAAPRAGRRPPSGELAIAKGPDYYQGQQVIVEDELLIGRAPPVDLVIPGANVSARHCRVFRSPTGGRFWVQDLSNDGGTLVNGAPVRRAVLRDGDRISVGGTEMVFRIAHLDGADGSETAEPPCA